MTYCAGLDIGSTTVKMVVLDDDRVVFTRYQRHFSDIRATTLRIIEDAETAIGPVDISMRITGSAGIGLASATHTPFIQEVIACTEAVEQAIPETDIAIELGGEDSKITFLEGTLEQRMNGTCAGGTGAFIDQMSTLLDTDASGINELAKDSTTIYPIASRCGVFAKSDVQPLINQGARKEDIAASVLQAVVNQTVASLAAGRRIKGKIAFLGGPLFFMSELRKRFILTLDVAPDDVIFPENSLLFVALGAAEYSRGRIRRCKPVPMTTLTSFRHSLVREKDALSVTAALPPLFTDEEELRDFRRRHDVATPVTRSLADYSGPAFLGIDAGSTTTKIVLLDPEGAILYSTYGPNRGEALETIVDILLRLYKEIPQGVHIARAAVTGYGEELLRSALHVDDEIVETIAHYRAASHFQPGVDFILDIGGQDMKAMRIKNGTLASIQLNEACSSGCGSFVEGFAHALNRSAENFAKEGLLARSPADLGSKCTVFMNSKVKQVQKEGFSIGDISAGLAYSVIKNALYKVIKVRHPDALGEHIVCQGGTFQNEAVLRAFELISGKQVIRPTIAGLMGAYGAALVARDKARPGDQTNLLTVEDLQGFQVEKGFTRCGICENNCLLTVTRFSDGQQFISGNRCERGLRIKLNPEERKVNLVEYRYNRLFHYRSLRPGDAPHGVIGLPRVLNVYDNYPLWYTVFTDLGFSVKLSPRSSNEIFGKGLETIPSDTICYPAKLSHGHVQSLIDIGVQEIFFPCVVYEVPEHPESPNNMNCVIIQGYPNILRLNLDEIVSGRVTYHDPVLNLADPPSVARALKNDFSYFSDITDEQWLSAVQHGFQELESFKAHIQAKGEKTLERMRSRGERGIVIAGRPYHGDPEINHGIAKVIAQEGFNVFTEDSICQLGDASGLSVLSQWEYASRIFAAAKVVAHSDDLDLVQLSSFGCALDSVSSDELQGILEPHGKICTIIKIDEGANLGSVRIRVRSLKETVEKRTLPRANSETNRAISGDSRSWLKGSAAPRPPCHLSQGPLRQEWNPYYPTDVLRPASGER